MSLLRWLRSKPKEAASSQTIDAEAVRSDESHSPAPDKVKIGLQSILQNLPPHLRSLVKQQLPDAELDLPLAEIQPQLATGKIAIRSSTFRAALPDTVRSAFDGLESNLKIPIPIRAIFSQLPEEALSRPPEQELEKPAETIETPFSSHVEEDALRFDSKGKLVPPASKPAPESKKPQPTIWTKNPELVKELQAMLMTDETLDYPKVLQHLKQLPGLHSCQLNGDDGRKIAGGTADASQEAAISSLVPNLFKTLDAHVKEMHLESLETVTFTCGKDQLSAFLHDHLCLTVLHDNRPFRPGIREKIQAVVRQLARIDAA
jgi:hypothetical protein